MSAAKYSSGSPRAQSICCCIVVASFSMKAIWYRPVCMRASSRFIWIAEASLQGISASVILRRMTWLREDNIVADEQHVGISKIGIEFGDAPEQRHRFKVLAFVRAIESQ